MAADPFLLLQMSLALDHGLFSFSLLCLKQRGAKVYWGFLSEDTGWCTHLCIGMCV